MKKNCFIFVSLIIQLSLSAQLKWLNPTPSGYANTKIQFTSLNKGYLMNFNGDLFHTSDTGHTWQNLGNFPGAKTFKIQQSTGLMPAYDTSVYLSIDNGVSWYKSPVSPGASVVPDWCDIIGRDTLFIQKYNGFTTTTSICRSVDRGTSWQVVNSGLNLGTIYVSSLDFITSQTGYALRPSGILKSTNGGVSWTEIFTQSTSANVICIKFYDELRGLAYRESFGMMRTVDGGQNWTVSNQVTQDIYDIFYVDSLNVYACGEDGVAYKSTDGGNNWLYLAPYAADRYHLNTQYFFSANDGIMAGHRGRIIRTRDGGTTWDWFSPTYVDVTAISFGNNSKGYATTWNNIYKATDNGITWNKLPLTTTSAGINSRFEHCIFSSGDTGIVSTNSPIRIYKTVDGGQNWATTLSLSPQYDYISSMSFINKDTGYAAVKGGLDVLLKTVNGGSSWQEIGSYQDFTLLHFINDTLGYATLYDKIFRTFNGGNSWTQLTPPTSYPFNAIWFTTPSKGFAIGGQGLLKMTVDSGLHWTNINLPVVPGQPDLLNIRFYDQRIGYITDDEGRYYKTIDSGYHWKQNGVTGFNGCRSILFRPDTTVVFAGIHGTIASRTIADFAIDSIQVTPGSCSAVLKAKISSFLSLVDSIWFEYGKNIYTSFIAGNPVSVLDTGVFTTATLNNLQPDSIYHFRVKILFKGKYYYSTDFVFAPKKPVAPVITASGNTLSSSVANGNQWYLNGTLLTGATGQQYTATVSGTYTVINTQGACISPPSLPYNLTITAIPDIRIWNDQIKIFPNPVVGSEVFIDINSNRKLVLQICDVRGRLIKIQSLNRGTNTLALPELQKGLYIFIIRDTKTFEKVQRKILKL